MTLHKEYVETEQFGTVKLSIHFNRDTINWATSQPKKVGYNLSVTPVKIREFEGHRTETTQAFSGYNTCILEVGRQSKKRLEEAIGIMQEYKQYYISLLNR